MMERLVDGNGARINTDTKHDFFADMKKDTPLPHLRANGQFRRSGPE